MHSRLFLALGSAAWLMTAGLACADEVATGSEKATEGTLAIVSDGNDDASADVSNGVEFRRNDSSRSGRSDQSSAGARSGERSGGNDGGGESGEGGGGGGEVE